MADREDRAGSSGDSPPIIRPEDSPEQSESPQEDGPIAHGDFLESAQTLVERLRQREEEFVRLTRITEQVNRGLLLEQVLDYLYEEARNVIPYNRIGFSLIDQARGVVVARWVRSDRPVSLKAGYEAPLAGSTLQQIIETGQPRIIIDLEAYLRAKPNSKSTILIVREGMRSSLTCPLIVQGSAAGFIFFSSIHKGTYSNAHVAFFQQIAGQLGTIVEKGRLYGELAEQKAIVERQNLLMTRDLEMARQVQQALVPQVDPELGGVAIAFRYEPAIQVGGDILDILPVGDGRVLFFVGDAMGHGVRAALVMSLVKAAVYSAVPTDPRPARVLASVNKMLARLVSDSFVTAACCLLDPGRLRAELALAGHAGPLWFQANGGDVVQAGGRALPLGLAEETQYETTPLGLGAGDALVFFTDGIVEAMDPRGNQYGQQRLMAQVLGHGRSSAAELCEGIRRDLEAHCGDGTRKDDLTLLVVKPTG